MKTKTSLAFSQKNENQQSFNIIGDLEVTIEVTRNPFHIPLEQLFTMAARMNKKRSFLFVSKVLGKHIPVKPHVSLLSGAALGLLVQQYEGKSLPLDMKQLLRAFEVPEASEAVFQALKQNKLDMEQKTLFIGFAETATALGHSMFDMFTGDVSFLHTTRENIPYMQSCIDFEEEHSHATAHRCYAIDPMIFQQAGTIILVDDEITTGKTALNIIHDLHSKYGKKTYIVASLLDWRSKADVERFGEYERELGVTIECLSLVSGEITVTGTPIEASHSSLEQHNQSDGLLDSLSVKEYFTCVPSAVDGAAYLKYSGRFGMTAADSLILDREVAAAAAYLRQHRVGERVLCMGSGEFMYIPMRIAAELGEGVFYHSSTRSPIHPDVKPEYAVHTAYRYLSPEQSDVMNFMYNIPHGHYDEMFFFMEREMPQGQEEGLRQVLGALGIPRIHIVYFST